MSDEPRITIPCPDCGHDLVLRANGVDGSRFLGCSTYPRCKHTEAEPAYMAMMAAGAKPLPGFE